MLKGDISNEVVARLVMVFEGLLGLFTDPKAQAKYDRAVKRGKWKEAADAFTINEIVAKHVWDLTWRRGYNLDIVTYLGVDFAEALQSKLERENLPVSRVYASTPTLFSRELAFRPDIAHVYDGDTSRVFTYGPKGTIVSPYQPHFM